MLEEVLLSVFRRRVVLIFVREWWGGYFGDCFEIWVAGLWGLGYSMVMTKKQRQYKSKAYFEPYQTIFFIRATLYRKFLFMWVPVKRLTSSTRIWDGESEAYAEMRHLREDVRRFAV